MLTGQKSAVDLQEKEDGKNKAHTVTVFPCLKKKRFIMLPTYLVVTFYSKFELKMYKTISTRTVNKRTSNNSESSKQHEGYNTELRFWPEY